jgi:hypothetical protein
MLAAALLLAAAAAADIDPSLARVFPSPPWTPIAHETQVRASPAFKPCEGPIRSMLQRVPSRITDERYAVSPRWGRIVRVRYIPAGGDDQDAFHITCWFRRAHGVNFVVAPEHMFAPPLPGQAHYDVQIPAPPPPPPPANPR